MRELKFRAWDKAQGKYVEVVRMQFSAKRMPILITQELSDKQLLTDPASLYVIEQYTGLKDKNGEDIYEGDIVEALIDGMWSTGRNTVSLGKAKWKLEVIHNDIRYMDVFRVIGSKNNPDRIYYLFDKELSELEVIGNIHENPELLEGKE